MKLKPGGFVSFEGVHSRGIRRQSWSHKKETSHGSGFHSELASFESQSTGQRGAKTWRFLPVTRHSGLSSRLKGRMMLTISRALV